MPVVSSHKIIIYYTVINLTVLFYIPLLNPFIILVVYKLLCSSQCRQLKITKVWWCLVARVLCSIIILYDILATGHACSLTYNMLGCGIWGTQIIESDIYPHPWALFPVFNQRATFRKFNIWIKFRYKQEYLSECSTHIVVVQTSLSGLDVIAVAIIMVEREYD